MAALGSLMANYTDSEDEDQGGDPPATSAIIPGSSKASSTVSTPSSSNNPKSNKLGGLVSYINEEEEDDDEDDDGNKSGRSGGNEGNEAETSDQGSVPMDLESPGKDEDDDVPEDDSSKLSCVSVDAWTDGVQLPPEPPGECSPSLQESVNRLYNKKLNTNFDMNKVIQSKKAFRNPSIYEKLIQFCEIDELGTNFPKELYDGHLFGKDSFYEELARVQKIDMDRREKLAQSKKEAAAAIAKRQQREAEAAGHKRKSKWDQVGPPPSNPPTTSALPPVVRPAPTLVSASASSSSKSISAFGPLKKH